MVKLPCQILPSVLSTSLFAFSLLGWESNKKMETTREKLSDDSDIVKYAEELYLSKYEKEKEVEVVKSLHSYLSQYKDSSNPDILWRLARSCYDLSKLSITEDANKKALTYEAHEIAKQALENGKDNFSCHCWFAITLSEVGDYEGIKQKISNAYKIQEHFKKAIELNPCDATSYHLYGRWCFTIADVPWYQRKIASAIFETPPSSTYEEAAEYFERAESVKASFYSPNQLMIAKCYLRLNNKAKAKEWLEKLIKYDVQTEEDVLTVKEGEELLGKC